MKKGPIITLVFLCILLTLSNCIFTNRNLDYPDKIKEIKEVVLSKPDKESNGKFATIKNLHQDQIVELLGVLRNAKSIGPYEFIPDYYLVFTLSLIHI